MASMGRQVVVKNCQGNAGSFCPGIAGASKAHRSRFVLLDGLTGCQWFTVPGTEGPCFCSARKEQESISKPR